MKGKKKVFFTKIKNGVPVGKSFVFAGFPGSSKIKEWVGLRERGLEMGI